MNSMYRYIADSLFFRILIIILATAAVIIFGIGHNWLWTVISVICLILGIFWIYKLYNQQNRKVVYMLDALENNDNALRFTEDEGAKENRKINKLLNRVARILYDVKAETAQQEKYYELILSFINTGIIVLNDSGAIYQKNNEAMHLLGLDVFTHIRQLNRIDPVLMEKLSSVKSGDKLQILFNNERGTINLSVRVSEITVKKENLRILALNDINNELDEKEIDSWIRLIRVLTHEIMNSITPITSLSDTLLTLSEIKDEEIRKGLQSINSTGKTLLSFLESYNTFAQSTNTESPLFYIQGFIDKILELGNLNEEKEVSPGETKSLEKEKYYELILNSINTGIVVINKEGFVYQRNKESLRLLGLSTFTHINQLNVFDPFLAEKITTMAPGEKLQVQLNTGKDHVDLSIHVSAGSVKEENIRIVAFTDISNELNDKEIDSWLQLIHVLTHEIMNSVSPITSLSDTLLSLTETKDEETRRGLKTISSTGKSLLSFVDSYRKFTRIPTPEPGLFYVKAFIERMVELAKHQINCNNISFQLHIKPADLILYADENLISQVIINLLKNAIEAIKNKPEGLIEINAYCNEAEEILIEVTNNGEKIPPEVAEQIFIPFFTTKNGGSGIGLSLSRQIMRLSGGSLTLKPNQPNQKTTFTLLFK